MLLDDLLPRDDVTDAHLTAVAASPERTIAAMLSVTPAEMPLARVLLVLRWSPSRLRGRRVLADAAPPLHDRMLGSGFVLLGEDPGREVVTGFAGRQRRSRRPTMPIRGPRLPPVFVQGDGALRWIISAPAAIGEAAAAAFTTRSQ